MSQYVLPVTYTLFVWWFSTGVILYLNGLPRWTFKWTMVGTTFVLVMALIGLVATRDDTRTTGAYLAFTFGLLVWAWQEVAFLLGYVTGPRRSDCPTGSTGWRRARFAFMAVMHHELALVVLGAAVLAATWGGANQTGMWTFLILWVMRQSAKLNVFLGVRNLNEGFLPDHLKYLQTYFTRRPMNRLFPVSVISSTIVAALIWQEASVLGLDAFDATSLTFAATLLTLAVLEHWFLVLPLPSEKLWDWGLRSRSPEVADQPPAAPPEDDGPSGDLKLRAAQRVFR
ncbi:MAG TPA: putative photosynthetic complex assembly protein PuhE [Burkholderiaceae bacterium]|nr:putative photosynthetic complex assembly protein PuhE [Burkholderiaceae bacterium]